MHKLIHVKWDDPSTYNGWRSEEEVDEWAKQDATLCETVGWKIRESKDYIILASSVNSEGHSYLTPCLISLSC